jgi:hypothetical protein
LLPFAFAFGAFKSHKISVGFEMGQNVKILSLAMAKVEKVNITDIY